MTDGCDADGGDNRAHTVIEKGDDAIEGMVYCEEHVRKVFFGETDE